jgi:hypothetical protein
MPRLIYADKLRKDVLDLPDCYNGFSDTYDKARILDLVDEQPTVDAIPIEWIKEWINNYCDWNQEKLIEVLLRTWSKMGEVN